MSKKKTIALFSVVVVAMLAFTPMLFACNDDAPSIAGKGVSRPENTFVNDLDSVNGENLAADAVVAVSSGGGAENLTDGGNFSAMSTSQDITLVLPDEDADFLAYNVDNFPDIVMSFFETKKLSIAGFNLDFSAIFAEGISLRDGKQQCGVRHSRLRRDVRKRSGSLRRGSSGLTNLHTRRLRGAQHQTAVRTCTH